jgi:alkylation response protein AidB-like acyl-CoA dehydrogenase
LAPFLCDVELSPDEESGQYCDVALWLGLGAWWMLGAAEAALELAAEHVSDRRQFGRRLASFQGTRLRLSDAVVATRGLLELASNTACRFHSNPDDALVDALGLRLIAQETVHLVFRTAHQLHGAVGFCHEHDLSILSRHIQPFLRLPVDYERTSDIFASQVEAAGFKGLFGRFSCP